MSLCCEHTNQWAVLGLLTCSSVQSSEPLHGSCVPSSPSLPFTARTGPAPRGKGQQGPVKSTWGNRQYVKCKEFPGTRPCERTVVIILTSMSVDIVRESSRRQGLKECGPETVIRKCPVIRKCLMAKHTLCQTAGRTISNTSLEGALSGYYIISPL